MIVRPIGFAVVAAFVVAAAGTGAYLAVRHNGAGEAVAEPAVDTATAVSAVPGQTEVAIDTGVVEATEEILEPAAAGGEETSADPPPAPLKPPSEDDRPARSEPSRDDAQPATVEATPQDTVQPDTRAATRPTRTDLPEVEGWTLSDSWPSRDDEPSPERVALSNVSANSLGATLTPEERPIIVEELIISADSVVGLQIDTPVSTEDAVVEDDVEARVTRDVLVGDHIAIPAGTRVMGSVVLVEQAGKIKGTSRLGVRFHTVVLDDSLEIPLITETVYREGKSKGGASAGKIGGAAVGGAILGAIFGGRQGAAIGGAAGAAGGTAAAMAGDGQPATLPAGSTVTVRLSQPATVTVERYPSEP